ncbi:MAG: hypothetical protein AAFP26_11250, partial [Planctomycetota bacterium]
MFHWLAERLKAVGRAPTRIVAVEADEHGMLLTRSEGEDLGLLWSDVARVAGYKRDLFTLNSIVIEFERVDGTSIWSWEEDQAFHEVVAAAERYLPGFPPYDAWYAVVVLPPMETRRHTLWGEPTPD